MSEKTVPVRQQQGAPVPATREESRYLLPPVDIYETAEGLVVVADLPGVDKNAVDVRVDNNVLTIEGKPAYQPGGRSVAQEFEMLDFYRQFELPDTVAQEKIAAEMKHGVLTVRLPKAEKAKPKQIAVQVS